MSLADAGSNTIRELLGFLLYVHDRQDSLIDWISDTRPQGCTDLQSPVKCLDHRYCGRYSMQSCKAVLGCTSAGLQHANTAPDAWLHSEFKGQTASQL